VDFHAFGLSLSWQDVGTGITAWVIILGIAYIPARKRHEAQIAMLDARKNELVHELDDLVRARERERRRTMLLQLKRLRVRVDAVEADRDWLVGRVNAISAAAMAGGVTIPASATPRPIAPTELELAAVSLDDDEEDEPVVA
jgi:hypothetical protein